MHLMNHLLLLTLLTNIHVECQTYEINRYAGTVKDGNEPYSPINIFRNEYNMCYFAYCWNLNAKCRGRFICCDCECNDGKTFFSSLSGCQTPEALRKWTKQTGPECAIYSTILGNKYVPLFFDVKKFQLIELSLFKEVLFNFYGNETVCTASHVYEFDIHGHQILYHRNQCKELFDIMMDEYGYHYLNYKSTDVNVWDYMKGRLFSVNIDCTFKDTKLTSCFLFQVEGKYYKGAHRTEPPTLPPDHTCDTKTTTATPQVTNATSTTSTITKQTTTTNNVSSVVIVPKKANQSSSSIGIAVGATVGIILLLLLILLVIVVRKKSSSKDKFRTDDPRLAVIPQANKYEDQYGHYAECGETLLRPTGAAAAPGSIDGEKNCLKALNETDYQYIPLPPEPNKLLPPDESHDYEPCDNICVKQPMLRHNSSCTSNTDMKTRPLPDKPTEVNNPYYCPSDDLNDENKDSGPNDLYELYSSVNEAGSI